MQQLLKYDTVDGMQKLFDLAEATGGLSIHTNKAQFGASPWAVEELDKTPMHPSVKDSFGLMITGGAVHHFSPVVWDLADHGLQYNTSDILPWLEFCKTDHLEDCTTLWGPLNDAVAKFRQDTPGAGAYFNEADYFEES